MSSIFSNQRGSLYPSFLIGKGGVTVYQGTSAPNNANGISGDFYLQQNGTASLSYIKQGTAWISNITAIVASGDVSGTGNASISLTLGTTGVTAGTYGSGTNFPQIVVDAKGRITSGTTVALGSMAGQGSNSVTITGGTITGLSTPINASDAATKLYVDAVVSGLNIHTNCEWATTGTLNGTYAAGSTGADGGQGVGATITRTSGFSGFSPDGTTASVGNRVLVKDQADPKENGIYTVTTVGGLFSAWVITRAPDYDNHEIATDVKEGDFVFVSRGTQNANNGWIENGSGPVVIGTGNIVYSQFSGAGQITNGTGLAKSGNTLSIATNGVSNALFRQSSPLSLVGNDGTATGNVSDIFLGTNLSFSSGTLNVTGLGTGTVTSIVAGTDLTGGTITTTGTLNLGTTGVTPGTYGGTAYNPEITVDAKGRITAINLIARGTMSFQDGSNVTITGGTITGMTTGTSSSDVATKGYVDGLTFAINSHASCELATNGTLNATYTAGTTLGADGGYGLGATLTSVGSASIQGVIDGYTNLIVTDRILVKDQTNQTENGIYVVSNLGGTAANWVLTRATDADNSDAGTELSAGDFVLIIDGTANAATSWINTSENQPTIIGSTNITWRTLNNAPLLAAGTGLARNTGTIYVGTNAITGNLFRQSSPLSLVGNTGTATGNVSDIYLGATLVINAGSVQTVAMSGDVTTSANSFATTLGTTGVTAGTYGNSTNIPQITVDAKGRITVGTNIAITYGTGSVTSVAIATGTSGIGVSGSPITGAGTITLSLGTITPTSVASTGNVTGANLSGTNTGNQTITLTGDVTTSGMTNGTFAATLGTSGVTAGTYGSGTAVFPIITVDAKGRITAASTGTVPAIPYIKANPGTNTTAPTVAGTDALAVGYNGTASGINSITIGAASAPGGAGIAIGAAAYASGSNSLAIGIAGTALAPQSTTLGIDATVGTAGTYSMALGFLSNATAPNALAISVSGAVGGTASGTGSLVISTTGGGGALTTSAAYNSMVFGYGTASTTGQIVFNGTTWINGISSITGDATGTANAGSLALTLGTTGVTAGTYGSQTTTSIITVDAKGRITAASTGTTTFGTGSVTTITTGTGLTGGTITNTGTIAMGTSGVTAGTYGSSTSIPQITVDALGRITVGTSIAVTIGTGSVTSIITDGGLTGGTITNTGTIGVATNGIINSYIRQSAGLSVIGNSSNATANIADITGTAANQVLKVGTAGTSIGFGALQLNQLSGDINLVTPVIGDILQYDGTTWNNVSGSSLVTNLHYYTAADSLGTSNSSLITYVSKVALTTATIVAGTYRIEWSASWTYTTASRGINLQVLVDGTQQYQISPKLPASNTPEASSSFFTVVFPTTGTHTVDLQYAATNVSDTASIWSAYLYIEKTSPDAAFGTSTPHLFTTATVTSSTYTSNAVDEYIGVNYAGAVTINLPQGLDGRRIAIKDESGLAGAGGRAISLVPFGTDLIEVNTINYNYWSLLLQFRGGTWWSI